MWREGRASLGNARENGNSRQETKQVALGATQRTENHWLERKGPFCFALLSLRFKAPGLSNTEVQSGKATMGNRGQPLYEGLQGRHN